MSDFKDDFDKKAKEKLSQITPKMVKEEGEIIGIVVWIPEVGEVKIYNPEPSLGENELGEYWNITPDSVSEFQEYMNIFIQKAKGLLIPLNIRFKVLQRDNFKCQYCGRSANDGAVLEVDHIIPKSKGGSDNMNNLTTACKECNRGKFNKSLDV